MKFKLLATAIAFPLVLTGCQSNQSSFNQSSFNQPSKASFAFAPLAFSGRVAASRVSAADAKWLEENALAPMIEPRGPVDPSAKKKRLTGQQRIAKGRHTYGDLIAKHAKANGVPLKLAMAVVEVESNYRPKAKGRAGEIGLMQLLPRTARFIGYEGEMKHLYHPDTNIQFGMKYLGKAHRLGGGSTCGTILKYNAGHSAKKMNRISRHYCQRVERIMSEI